MKNLTSSLILSSLFLQTFAHSWNYNPVPRDYYLSTFGDIDNSDTISGCKYTRSQGETLTYSRGGIYEMRKVSRGKELCVSWMANGHPNDPARGYVRISLSTGSDDQENFDNNILLANVDFAAFEGVRVTIPEDTPLGLATLKFYWDYCGSGFEFASCSDILILETDDPEGQNYGLTGFEDPRYLGNCAAGTSSLPDPNSFTQNSCDLIPLPEGTGGEGEGEETTLLDTCKIEYRTIVNGEQDFITIHIPLNVSSDCVEESSGSQEGSQHSTSGNDCQLHVTTELGLFSDTGFGSYSFSELHCGDTSVCDPPCVNGICEESVCLCNTGWSGETCETPVCSPVCQNGGVCQEGNVCDCSGTGFTGNLCQTEVTCDPECVNGECVESGGVYTCDCDSGWTGETCETESPPLGRCLTNCDCWGSGNYCKTWQTAENGM